MPMLRISDAAVHSCVCMRVSQVLYALYLGLGPWYVGRFQEGQGLGVFWPGRLGLPQVPRGEQGLALGGGMWSGWHQVRTADAYLMPIVHMVTSPVPPPGLLAPAFQHIHFFINSDTCFPHCSLWADHRCVHPPSAPLVSYVARSTPAGFMLSGTPSWNPVNRSQCPVNSWVIRALYPEPGALCPRFCERL